MAPVGTLTGFAYLVDQDEAAVQGFRLSSQTYGAALRGEPPVGKDVKLSYAASWARQSDWRNNPNHYAADYMARRSGADGAGAERDRRL
jgi:hypothetical protein